MMPGLRLCPSARPLVSSPVLFAAMALAALGGCVGRPSTPPDPSVLFDSAVGVINTVLTDPVQAPADSTVGNDVRRNAELAQFQLQAQALEVASEFPTIMQPAWLRSALDSRSDGVRYAALLTLGKLADFEGGRLARPFTAKVRQIADEKGDDGKPRNQYLHLAASYALYKLTGDAQAVLFMPPLLSQRSSPGGDQTALARFRAEVVYILSLMPGLKPRPLLQVALTDPNILVRAAASNRLALLGDEKALEAVINMLQSPAPDEQLDALDTLGQVTLNDLEPLRVCFDVPVARFDAFRKAKLAFVYPEVRMAAARALGLHGDARGQKLALAWLDYTDPEKLSAADLSKDPLHEYRVRFLAALALGAIGNYDQSAGPLADVLESSSSRRFQLTAARASLELLKRSNNWPVAAGR